MSGVGESNRPSESSFYNQRLKAWHPILTPRWVIISFSVIGVVFMVIGLGLYFASEAVLEYTFQYDGPGRETDACVTKAEQDRDFPQKPCSIKLKVDPMPAPILVYYQLDNFYQNHRRYVKSRSDDQLQAGKDIVNYGRSQLSDCNPLLVGDLRENVTSGEGPRKILAPCGLIANSFFNDTFSIKGYNISSKNIAWESDRKYKFKAVPESVKEKHEEFQWIDETYPGVESIEDEHFIVWMRTAALPSFRKLYGRIEKDIKKETELEITIGRHFPVSSFEGSKTIVLTTSSFLGGKNSFLGAAYLTVGAICIILAISFYVKELLCPRKPGDVRWLRWRSD